MKKLGIPYMGSKRKLASKIIDHIIDHNPNCKYFYDLFGGGGAISFEALQRKQFKQVYYNELNTGVVNLLKKIKTDGVTDEFYDWVDRDTYHEYKNGDCWKSGLIKICWSFGNNNIKGYLFSPENEKKKKILHLAIVEKDVKFLDEFGEEYKLKIPYELLEYDTINERRLKVMNFVKKETKRTDLEQLEQLQQLERLQQLEQLQQLELSNLSYDGVEITTPIDETIIYLDPPYKNTSKYQLEIDHEKLYEYIKNSPYKIYMSSYDMPFDVVKEFEQRCKLSSTVNNKVVEKLFCNQEENEIEFIF